MLQQQNYLAASGPFWQQLTCAAQTRQSSNRAGVRCCHTSFSHQWQAGRRRTHLLRSTPAGWRRSFLPPYFHGRVPAALPPAACVPGTPKQQHICNFWGQAAGHSTPLYQPQASVSPASWLRSYSMKTGSGWQASTPRQAILVPQHASPSSSPGPPQQPPLPELARSVCNAQRQGSTCCQELQQRQVAGAATIDALGNCKSTPSDRRERRWQDAKLRAATRGTQTAETTPAANLLCSLRRSHTAAAARLGTILHWPCTARHAGGTDGSGH